MAKTQNNSNQIREADKAVHDWYRFVLSFPPHLVNEYAKMYHRVTTLYFGGMGRHLENLRLFLKKGAMLGYVVGDQASFLQVHIPTGKILADIARHLGYEVVSIDLFRTRFATATQTKLNEEVVVLRWNGGIL